METNPDSFLAMAYLIREELVAGKVTDDTRLDIRVIQAELKAQFGDEQRKDDFARLRQGMKPEPSRMVHYQKRLETYALGSDSEFEIVLPNVLIYGDAAYIEFVGKLRSKYGFVPGKQRWQLEELSRINNKPAFCASGSSIYVLLTDRTVLMAGDLIDIICAKDDSFPSGDFDDPFYWKTAWNANPSVKNTAKMQATRMLMQTHYALRQFSDTKNNGTEE